MITREKQRENQLSNSLRHLQGYNKEYNIYAIHQQKRNWPILKAFEMVTDDMVIGDFGCLDGSVTYEMSKRCRHAYGFDLPRVIDNILYHDSDKLSYHGMDLDIIFPVPVNTWYDLIIAVDIIEHLYDPLSFLIQCYGNIEGRGRIIISTPLSKVSGQINQDPSRQSHFREYTREEFDMLLKSAGIDVEEEKIEKDMIHIIGKEKL